MERLRCSALFSFFFCLDEDQKWVSVRVIESQNKEKPKKKCLLQPNLKWKVL